MTSTDLPPRTAIAAPGDHAMLLVALELSRAGWLVAASMPGADRVSRYHLAGGDGPALLELLDMLKRRAEHAGRGPVRIVAIQEAGFDGFWLHRLFEARGIESHVVDPASIAVNRRQRRAKTDRIDAEMLLRTLAAWKRGERRVCSMVHPPSPEDEDDRRLGRERQRLVKEKTQHVNRIKGLLATQGIAGYEPARRDRRACLDELRTGDGRALPPRLREEIVRELGRLELVLSQTAEVEAERDAAAAASGPGCGRIGALTRLKGIGPEIATLLQLEAFFRTFRNRREVAAYAGLVPVPWKSGGLDREQGISKAGNPRLRAAMVELAWLWLRHQPGSALSAWFRGRVGETRGRVRRIAIVALARRLLVALWRYVEAGIVPAGAEMKTLAARR